MEAGSLPSDLLISVKYPEAQPMGTFSRGKELPHRQPLKYLLRDGLEIGMSAGTRPNPQCFSLQYLINLILLLVRGESVAD